MNRNSNILLIILLTVTFCKEPVEFYDTPKNVEGLIERMVEENTGLELSIFVEYTSQDSLFIQYYLVNTKMKDDTLVTSSGFPTRIAYRYGEELTYSFEKLIFPDDERLLSVSANDSILLSEWNVKKVDKDDYIIRGVFRFSWTNDYNTNYWLVSEPVMVQGSR